MPAAPPILGSTGSTTFVLVALLVVLGITMVVGAVWLVRATRTDTQALGPLEVMGDRRFARHDADARAAVLAGARPEGAVGPAPMVEIEDDEDVPPVVEPPVVVEPAVVDGHHEPAGTDEEPAVGASEVVEEATPQAEVSDEGEPAADVVGTDEEPAVDEAPAVDEEPAVDEAPVLDEGEPAEATPRAH